MKLCDLTAQAVVKPVMHYSEHAMNKVVRHNFEMVPIFSYGANSDSYIELYRGMEETDSYGVRSYRIFGFYPGVKYGLILLNHLRDIPESDVFHTVEEISQHVANSHYITLDAFKRHFDQSENGEFFIDLLTIEFVRQFDAQRAERYTRSREIYAERRNRQYAEERAARKAEEAAYVQEKNDEAEALIETAIETIRRGGEVGNDTVEIFKSRYDSSCYSLVNVLLRRYGIDVPLRTQGWIAGKLARFSVSDGQLGTCYYIPKKRNEKASSTYQTYLRQLIAAVQKEAAS